MKQAKTKNLRLKLILMTAGAAVAAALLLIASCEVRPDSIYVTSTTAAASAPASAPASRIPPIDPKKATAQNMSNMLLLFSLVGFALTGVGIGWLVYQIRQSRPAWQKQQRYPKHR